MTIAARGGDLVATGQRKVYLLCLVAACVAAGGVGTTRDLVGRRGELLLAHHQQFGGWGDLNPQPLLESQMRCPCGMVLQ